MRERCGLRRGTACIVFVEHSTAQRLKIVLTNHTLAVYNIHCCSSHANVGEVRRSWRTLARSVSYRDRTRPIANDRFADETLECREALQTIRYASVSGATKASSLCLMLAPRRACGVSCNHRGSDDRLLRLPKIGGGGWLRKVSCRST